MNYESLYMDVFRCSALKINGKFLGWEAGRISGLLLQM